MHFRALDSGKTHKFVYRVFRVMLDVDAIDAGKSSVRLLSIDRFNLLSLRSSDHGPCDGSNLRNWVEARLAEQGLPKPTSISLYAFPRVLGYVFNPLSVYFCRNEAGRIFAAVYEVRNTLGDLHPYTVAVPKDALAHERAEKGFYVSPFIGGPQRYTFHHNAPDERFALRIRVDGARGLTLIASETMAREPLSNAAILRAFFGLPLMTLKVVGGIYYEAVRLRLKGARIHPYPGPGGQLVERPAQ